MRIVRDFPRPVRVLETVWITLSDGCRLAGRVWLPTDAERDPVPAIFELLPYRLNDGTAVRDSRHYPYLAGHGYACVRIDQRGTGESDGLILDEYLPQEQEDAVEAIDWIAGQPWCTGAVGMIGISWSGFNSLQVAARRPRPLRAIVTLCSTDDRYADDVHYKGGCLLASDMLQWASSMFAFNARPPDPAIVGSRWREMWLERMEQTPPFIEEWLRHQRRDEYWKQGSVCEDYAAIEAAVYAVGGWADGYTNAVPRLLAGLPGPRKGLIGPWAHAWPQSGPPGPTIGFLQEVVRWFDHWLKGAENGIMEEPLLRAWMQEWVPPAARYESRPGRWVAEPAWPASRPPRRLYLNAGTLDPDPRVEGEMTLRGLQTTGLGAGSWCPYGEPADMPEDQRADEGTSLSFTSAPLSERIEILGYPEVVLALASDRAQALVSVRLADVAPDGASTLVSRALLNLSHRHGHEHPAPLTPGERVSVHLRLDAVAHAFPAGHRLRLAVSPTYWPWAWPSPMPVALTLFAGAGILELPVRPPQPGDRELRPFLEPEEAEPLPVEVLRTGPAGRELARDLATNRVVLHYDWDVGGLARLPNGLETQDTNRTVYSIVEGDPVSASVRCEMSASLARGEWRTRVETLSTMSADAEQFLVTNTMDAFEGETRVFSKTWTSTFPRDHQ
jgi:putative CocE/NonD family hydrolase